MEVSRGVQVGGGGGVNTQYHNHVSGLVRRRIGGVWKKEKVSSSSSSSSRYQRRRRSDGVSGSCVGGKRRQAGNQCYAANACIRVNRSSSRSLTSVRLRMEERDYCYGQMPCRQRMRTTTAATSSSYSEAEAADEAQHQEQSQEQKGEQDRDQDQLQVLDDVDTERERLLQLELSVGHKEDEFIIAEQEGANHGDQVSANATEAIKSQLRSQLGTTDNDTDSTFLSITVVGASGDLAKKKIYPALFALYYEGHLKENFVIYGYARTKKSRQEFCNDICLNLSCRIDEKDTCGPKMDKFLEKCFYHSGGYDSLEGFSGLAEQLTVKEGGRKSNRLFYFSIPPNVFVDAAEGASRAASSTRGWTRVIVEKPFGRDLGTSRELSEGLYRNLTEDQIYRIDHYLGKELVENLSVLRFSNLVFQPLWTRQYIRNVQIIFSENFGTEGRGGYFDNYGIIRDIMQNHLLQILALFAMEQPVSLNAEDIRDEKVKLLRSIKPLKLDNIVIGQYKGTKTSGGKYIPGYLEDDGVPKTSLTPTFSAMALFIDNPRWDGVPFLMKAGKALAERRAEIRVQFRHVPGNLYKGHFGANIDTATNELVIRLQPDSGIYLRVNNKIPGIGLRLDRTNLDLIYKTKYTNDLPDAYERLLLDAIHGDKRLFIRNDELDHAWKLFTPLLHKLEESKQIPELYPFGSRGPLGAHYLAAKYGVRWGDLTE